MQGTWQEEPLTGAAGQVCKGGFVGLGNSAHRGVGSQTFLKPPSGSSNSGWGSGLRSCCLRDEGQPLVSAGMEAEPLSQGVPCSPGQPTTFPALPGTWILG